MTPQPDPYRTLGVAPSASVNEIRSAYRRLAKQYHPDAAGDRALPRFLAIQAAYEQLVDGEGRMRAPMGAAPAGEPWRADPARARASRDAWRARRSRSSGAGQGGAGATAGEGERAGAPGASRPGGEAAGKRRGSGSAPRGPGGTGARGVRKARPGSTTYDEAAAAPLDPDWDGSDWYGPSSGTYWTLNPREYADPRKHGPEYQARARRAAGERGGATGERGRAAVRPGPEAGEAGPDEDEVGADAGAGEEPAAARSHAVAVAFAWAAGVVAAVRTLLGAKTPPRAT
jgi:hypothetical protein